MKTRIVRWEEGLNKRLSILVQSDLVVDSGSIETHGVSLEEAKFGLHQFELESRPTSDEHLPQDESWQDAEDKDEE